MQGLIGLVVAAILAIEGMLLGGGGGTVGPAPSYYVALGDSYTAGPLIAMQLADPPGCLRSDHDYPHLVAQRLGVPLRDVSCSGAGTADLTHPQPLGNGANPPQLDALDGETRLVTVSIGGNDIGFTDIVKTCATLIPLGQPCQDRQVVGGTDEIQRQIAETAPKIRAVLDDIRRRAPRSRVFVVGYPAIVPETDAGCWPVLPFAPGDLGYLRNKEKELNAVLATDAAAAGATYVDAYGPSIGHDACAPPEERWVEPVLPSSPAAPVHPNANGMNGVADAVVQAIGR